jgi:hypothetical protein
MIKLTHTQKKTYEVGLTFVTNIITPNINHIIKSIKWSLVPVSNLFTILPPYVVYVNCYKDFHPLENKLNQI